MYLGGCLCNKIRFEIHGTLRNIIYCHCSQCRKAQGSAFATNGIVSAEAFKIVQGEQALSAYATNDTQTKYFCRHCGSPIMSKNRRFPDQVRVRLGTIETPIKERPEAHIFVTSRAEWDHICDDLPQFEEYESTPR